MEIKYIPIGDIRFNHLDNARTFDLLDCGKLARSMERVGLWQPIGVFKDGDGYAISFGFRRYTAARLLEWTTIPCVIVPKDLAFELNAEENLCREDLRLKDQVELVKKMGDRAEKILGRSSRWCNVRRKIGKLRKGDKALFYSGLISPELVLSMQDEESILQTLERLSRVFY